MKVIIIDGVQNAHNSMTERLVNKCVEGIRAGKPDAEIQIVKLLETDIKFCIGCKKCGTQDDKPVGTCVLKDAMQTILPDLLAADHIVFASPIYDFTMSALLLRFVERTLPLHVYPENSWPKARNKTRSDKKGLILFASDCPPPLNWLIGLTWHPSVILRLLCRSAGCAKTQVISAGGMRFYKTLLEKFEKKAYEAGRELVS
ncbi:MAG: flavodoxin family protein [Gammaproteobacteria bacterium]